MASVTLHRLTKTFDPGRRLALAELSLEVHDGEFFVLLGPSASGKTTVLRCIAGLEEPSAGEIFIGDHDVTHLPPGERDVAMVFQSGALYPHLTVRENLAFGLEVRRVAATDMTRRVAHAAERLGLTPLLERRPGELSGGERQRVALGRAIVREPRVFLFDEPLSNLEPSLRATLRGELVQLQRALGVTALYVTHDQVEAMTMGHRIAVLDAGRVRQIGTPAELYGRPADVFVARFLGSPGMNILSGRARAAGERKGIVDCGAWTIAVPLEDYEGQIQLGLRPEHVGVCAPDRGTTTADVRGVEPLGPETLVHLDVAGQPVVARAPGFPDFRPGDRVGVTLDPRHLHLFDATGTRLR
ncbi:MAG TPA: ABC transporter ATP-binding protein [Gemmatimonadales bacterium]|nr:ABC transporter ATP-binding protein [Gemmatimonadales bacterium]